MIRRIGLAFGAGVTVGELRNVLNAAPDDSTVVVFEEGEIGYMPASQTWEVVPERTGSLEWTAQDQADWEWRKTLKELLDLVHSVMLEDSEGGDDPEDA